jgi:hypothetical protein
VSHDNRTAILDAVTNAHNKLMVAPAKHTPGPWIYVDADSKPKGMPCVFHDNPADGHLIAAAPELLKLAQILIDITTNSVDPEDFTAIRNDALAVIAKAEGRE